MYPFTLRGTDPMSMWIIGNKWKNWKNVSGKKNTLSKTKYITGNQNTTKDSRAFCLILKQRKTTFLENTLVRSSDIMTNKQTDPWRCGEPLTDEEFREVRYATRIWLLQERVPLSFIEARIYLHEEKPESLNDIATRFGIPLEEIARTESSVKMKVENAEQKREIFFGHSPIYPA